jgi:DNA-binding SARP family transcriptional activator
VIRVLGPLQVVHGETPVDIGSPRHREVLAALAVDAGRVVPTETLLERVWGDGSRGATTANLHAVISRLRGRLRSASRAVEIATAPPGYRLDAPGAIDAEAFQDLFARARSARAAGDLPAARAHVDEALGLWRGAAYADIHHPFAEAEAARLDGQRLAANELAAELDLALGRHDRVLDRLPARASQRLGQRRKWKKFFMQCRVLPPPFVVLVRLQEPHGKEA